MSQSDIDTAIDVLLPRLTALMWEAEELQQLPVLERVQAMYGVTMHFVAAVLMGIGSRAALSRDELRNQSVVIGASAAKLIEKHYQGN